jgi:hypothetical protein
MDRAKLRPIGSSAFPDRPLTLAQMVLRMFAVSQWRENTHGVWKEGIEQPAGYTARAT